MTTDTPCAACPSPILDGAPRFSELRMLGAFEVYAVEEFHPGCWAAEGHHDQSRPSENVRLSNRRTDA